MSATVTTSLRLAGHPAASFGVVLEELAASLGRVGLRVELGPGGRILDVTGFEAGRVREWEEGKRAVLEWRAADWQPEETSEIELRVEEASGEARVVIEHRGFGAAIDDDVAGWFADELASALLWSSAPSRLGDWLTDRRARRPTGAGARAIYGDPLYHRPNFRLLLDALALTPDDNLLEVGCGGGAFLQEALESGCVAGAVDHSDEMVELARAQNADAISGGRLEIVQGDAHALPFADGTFTCAVMTGVLQFLADPVTALAEVHRVLLPGGRLAVFTASKELRGTLAAPEPMASRLRFFEADELEQITREAGFADARVELPEGLEDYAREVGVPEEHLDLFRGRTGGQLLLARRM